MRIIGLPELQAFKDRHADVRSQVDAWLNEVETAQWNSPIDVTGRFASASILSENQVVFNLKGNKYRLLVKINYKNKIVFIRKAGTHAEYSRWTI